MPPPADGSDDTWVCPPCRLSILRENSRQSLKPLKKGKPRTQGPGIVFRMECTKGEQQPAAGGNEGGTDQEPKNVIKIFIDLTHLALQDLFGGKPLETPEPAEKNAPIQEPQEPASNKNGEQSPPQDANGPGAINNEPQPSAETRRTSEPFLDFLHPAFFRPGRNAARPHTATPVKAKKPKGGNGAKGRRGK